jgi:hypothetical protein
MRVFDLQARWGAASSAPADFRALVPGFILSRFPRLRDALPTQTDAVATRLFRGESVTVSLAAQASVELSVRLADENAKLRDLLLMHAVAHAMCQPMLDANQGPLVVVLASSPDASAAACAMLLDAAEDIGLVVHDTASGMMPAMPPNRRPDIAVGTPRSVMEHFASRFFSGDRVSLVVALDPVETLRDAPGGAGWLVTHGTFRGPVQTVALSRLFAGEGAQQVPPTADGGSAVEWSVAALRMFHAPLTACSGPASSSEARVGEPTASADAPLEDQPLKASRAEAGVHLLVWNAMPDSASALVEWPCAVAEGVDDACGGEKRAGSPSFVGTSLQVASMGTSKAVAGAAGLGLLGTPPRVGVVVTITGQSADEVGVECSRKLSGRRFGSRRIVALALSDDPLKFDVEQLEAVVPRVLLFRNCAKSHDAMRSPGVASAVARDITSECQRFGRVVSHASWLSDSDAPPHDCFDADEMVYHDTCRVFVEFATFVAAEAAQNAMHGVAFDGRTLHVTFFDTQRYVACELAPERRGEEELDAVELL